MSHLQRALDILKDAPPETLEVFCKALDAYHEASLKELEDIEALMPLMTLDRPERLVPALKAWAAWYSTHRADVAYSGQEQDLFEALDCNPEVFTPETYKGDTV